jgi:glycosyltransferase involved in cell wall biosynthesis
MKVSIILPTYNRARFLERAIDSIGRQTFHDWELIVVDDGSTDETPAILDSLLPAIRNPTHRVHQENSGAAAARNHGLDLASAPYIAFFDSDDLWIPTHLERCISQLEEHPEIDWIYCAATRVEAATGRILQENLFYHNGQPRPFLKLNRRVVDGLYIIEDPGLLDCAIEDGIACLLQTSVIRRTVFDTVRFWEQYAFGAVCEDVFLILRCIARGVRFAYFDAPHVTYQVHQENLSLVAESYAVVERSPERCARHLNDVIASWLHFASCDDLTSCHRAHARRKAAQTCYWMLGYSTYWAHGMRGRALAAFTRGLSIWPWDWRFWKTYLTCWFRAAAPMIRSTGVNGAAVSSGMGGR